MDKTFEEDFQELSEAADNAAEDIEVEVEEAEEAETPAEEPSVDWEHKYKSEAGRITAYQNQVSNLREEIEALKSRPVETKQEAIDNKDWEELMETEPELARAIESKLSVSNSKAQQLESEIARIKQAEAARQQEANKRYREGQLAALQAAHEDYGEIRSSPDFKMWVDESPDHIKEIVSKSDSASDAIWLLNQYKKTSQYESSEVGKIKAKRQKAMQESATPVRGQNISPSTTDPDDFENSFKFFAKQKEKKRMAY